VTEPLRVAINCELPPGTQAGGTQSAVTGLVRALGALDGPEEYLLICHPQNRAWIEPVAGANTRLVEHPPKKETGWRAIAHRVGSALQNPADRSWPPVPCSDGFYESLGAHVIHWPWQHFVVTALPSIFNPHDLLHLHHPQFFSALHIAARESLYPVACRLAHTVVAGSEWTQQDLMRHYSLHPSRVQIIPWAPPTEAAPPPDQDAVARVRATHSLPERFAFYPAVTWPHKNHLRLLAALADLRDRRGVRVHLVCSGHREPTHSPLVEAEVRRLRLESQVHFVGQVSHAELRAIFRAAEFVFVPTLFEAASGPVFEAWLEDVPVACSTVTSLPQQAGNAALLFDPWNVEAIADALARMATDTALRETLRLHGRRRLADFSWERTATAYRAVYRRAAGRALSGEDAALLAWDWMRNSRPLS
jgi:glycosyltransferase involved in cell wall biosynthesis